MTATPVIQLKNVSFHYPQRPPVLEGFDLTVMPGEKIALQGRIGSGKTTLLHLIVGLLTPAAGGIALFGRNREIEKDFHDVRGRIGLLFQDPDDQLFCPTVEEEIAFGPLNQGLRGQEVESIVRESLDSVGLTGFERRITHHLSGGEKRLVALASVLAMKPEFLLLDEPENDLGPEARERMTSLLANLKAGMMIVSHDRSFTDRLTSRTITLD